MSHSIWKYACPYPGEVVVRRDMPPGKVISVQIQAEVSCFWVEVDLDGEKSGRTFTTIGTGHPLPAGAEYCGTYQQPPFVWHLYELK